MSGSQTFTVNARKGQSVERLVEAPAPVVSVEPPVACVDIRQFAPPTSAGRLALIDETAVRTIGDAEHARLLREGLTRNRQLWKALAAR